MNALYIITGLGLVTLLMEVFKYKKLLTATIIAGLIAAIATNAFEWGLSVSHFSEMVVFNDFALAFSSLIILTGILWFWMSRDYITLDELHQTDRASLVLFNMVGGVLVVSFNHLAVLFLGIEILSLSIYALAAGNRESLSSTEAGFKYFIMGSFATGFLLLGMALIYGSTGSFYLPEIASAIADKSQSMPVFFLPGILLLLVGLTFKISAVPFHFWAPDVYTGAPTNVTAFMAAVVKIATVGAFIHLFSTCFSPVQELWTGVLQVMAVLTLFIPNLIAAIQSNVKRMLAYSSVAHAGVVLMAFIAAPVGSASAIFYYLVGYAVATILAFAVLLHVEKTNGALDISQFNGLFKRNPLLATGFTAALLSLAGIPPLTGFLGKYFAFVLVIQAGLIWLGIIAIIASLVGTYYYFRVIRAMFLGAPAGDEFSINQSHKILIVLLVAALLALTVFPDAVLGLVA